MTFLYVVGVACFIGSVALYVAWRRDMNRGSRA